MSTKPAFVYLNLMAPRGFAAAGVKLAAGETFAQVKLPPAHAKFLRARLGWSAFRLEQVSEQQLGDLTKSMARGEVSRRMSEAESALAQVQDLREQLKQARAQLREQRAAPLHMIAEAAPAALADLAPRGIDVEQLQAAAQAAIAPPDEHDVQIEAIDALADIASTLAARKLRTAGAIIAAGDDHLAVDGEHRQWTADEVRAAAQEAIEQRVLAAARAASLRDLQAVDGIGKANAEALHDHHRIDSRHKLHAVLRDPPSRKKLMESYAIKASAKELDRWIAQLDQAFAGITE